MPNQQQSSSSAQTSNDDHSIPHPGVPYLRTGKITVHHYTRNNATDFLFSPFVMVIQHDVNKEALRDESGTLATHDPYGNPYPPGYKPLRVDRDILKKALEDNKQRLIAQGETIDEDEPQHYIRIDDIVRLKYENDCLVAMKKIT